MKKWRCTVCHYIHLGDTPPDQCPECGVSSEKYEFLEEVRSIEGLDPEEVEQVLPVIFKLTYGMFVVSSRLEEKINAQVCNTVFQVSQDPFLIAVGINKLNLTHQYILESGVFTANVMSVDDLMSIRRFGFVSGRDRDKFGRVNYSLGKTGSPYLNDGSMGYFECQVVNKMDARTHTLFLGEVVGGKLFSNKEPMTYAWYRANK